MTHFSSNIEFHNVPADWVLRELGLVALLKTGGSAPQGDKYFNGGRYPFVRVQHFDGTEKYLTRWDLITDQAVKDYRLKLFKKDTILFPKSGASIMLEKRAKLPFDSYVVSHLCCVEPIDVESDFLFYLLKFIKFAHTVDGSTLPYLNLNQLAKRLVPVPPLPEQRRIAHVLTIVQFAIEQQARLIALTRELKSALMCKLFTEGLRQEKQKETEIGLVPESWAVGKFIELCILQRGFDITKKEQISGSVPVVSSGGVSSYHNVAKVKAPGVVIGRKGSLGTVHYIDVDYWPHDTTLWVKDFKGNDPLFTAYFLETLHLEKYNSGASNPTLNRNTVHSETISYPQVDDQKEIGQILHQCDAKIRITEEKKKLYEELFGTLLHQLMTGQVRVNDLDIDSPSSLPSPKWGEGRDEGIKCRTQKKPVFSVKTKQSPRGHSGRR